MKEWSFDNNWGGSEQKAIETEKDLIPDKRKKRRAVALEQRLKNTIYRRAYSETQLLDVIGFEYKDGDIYHLLTAGDVDALSYLKLMVRQQNLEYVLFSTWCMANDDILQIEEWLLDGKIKKIDAYVGEIFPGTYSVEYQELKRVITEDIGRVVVFRNHAKIFAGYGKKFHFGIQTSANINTNPRTENGCITIGKEIFDFYKEYYDGINSFQ